MNDVTVGVNAVVDDDTRVLLTWKLSASYMKVLVGAEKAVTLVLLGTVSID